MARYVALLRGINSGQNPSTKMDRLREAFEELGFDNVITVIASGNVLFDTTGRSSVSTLETRIEKSLGVSLGFSVPTIVLTLVQLEALRDADPFADVSVGKKRVPQVSFVKGRKLQPGKFPVTGKGYTLVRCVGQAVCSVVDLTEGSTPDLMKALERDFGRNVTTRTWKTIERILKKAESS